MSFRLVPKSVTLNNLNCVMAVTLRYSTEFGKPALQKTICGGIYIVFLVRVQCRHKESSRSLSHLMMSFLFYLSVIMYFVTLYFIKVKKNPPCGNID